MKEKRLIFVMILLVTGVMLFARTIGTIEYLEGRVEIIRDGRPLRRLDMGAAIENLDQISTAADSLITVSFLPETRVTGTITVSEKSSTIIRLDKLAGVEANELYLLGGSVAVKVKRLGNTESSFRVRTPTSVLGVRGTEFVAAAFFGNSLVACREGEVYCHASGRSAGMRGDPSNGVSAVPGRVVEIPETGTIKTGAFPDGEFYEQWQSLQDRWRTFHVELISADPVIFIDRLASSWENARDAVLRDAAVLRKNDTASRWLENARRGEKQGTRREWTLERPRVMKDLLTMRPHLVMASIPWLRIQELIPILRTEDQNRVLSNGQTVRAFVRQFDRDSRDFASAMSLFYALEKQYMLRNDGLSPFMDF